MFRVLGPMELDGRLGVVAIDGTRARTVLAGLLRAANRPVSMSRLVELVWPEEAPPPSAPGQVRNQITALRRSLHAAAGPAAPRLLSRTSAGYRLSINSTQLDAVEAERLDRQAREAVAGGRLPEAA